MLRLGILGGGQLAQMLTQAAISLSIETVIFERYADSPAARLTDHDIVADWYNEAALVAFSQMCDVVTLENEFVDSSVLRQIEAAGVPVYPTSTTLAAIQDKYQQKQAMQLAGLPVPDFRAVHNVDEVLAVGESFGWPVVMKARRDGYDGYGNATLNGPDDVSAAWERLAEGGRELFVESYIPFVRELAVMILRGRDGEIRHYPLVETIQHNHICHMVRVPAPVSDSVLARAYEVAERAVEVVDGVGVFGVELFQLEDRGIMYNEIAPRPHNSGHYTIEACVTSQFENHIRAVMGWPLGSVEMRTPTAVMVNLLGARVGDPNADCLREALSIPDAHVHIYGKRTVRVGRKMGHVTVLGDDLESTEAAAKHAVQCIDL